MFIFILFGLDIEPNILSNEINSNLNQEKQHFRKPTKLNFRPSNLKPWF